MISEPPTSLFSGRLQERSFSQSSTRQRGRELSPPSASETEVRPSRQVFPEIPSGLKKYILPSENRRVIGKFEQKRWMHVPLPPRLMVSFCKTLWHHLGKNDNALEKMEILLQKDISSLHYIWLVINFRSDMEIYIYYMMMICKCWSHTSISLVHHHCLRRFCDAHRPSCSRWICSALRRYRSWQR